MSGSILSALTLAFGPKYGAPARDRSDTSFHDIDFEKPDGSRLALSEFAGQAVLLVNMASKCRFRQQFAELEALHREAGNRGLVILGLPSNDFANQEPGDSLSIEDKYRRRLDISFPVTAKVCVKGADRHAFFSRAVEIAGAAAVPKWNFYKYLLNREGRLVAWYSTRSRPSRGGSRRRSTHALRDKCSEGCVSVAQR